MRSKRSLSLEEPSSRSRTRWLRWLASWKDRQERNSRVVATKLKCQSGWGLPVRSGSMGEALADPLLGCVQISKGWAVDPIQPAKTCFQIPLPRSDLVLVREVYQHRQQSLLLIEDHHAG